MLQTLRKANFEVYGQVRYEKAIVVFSGDEAEELLPNRMPHGTDAVITVKNRKDVVLETYHYDRWEVNPTGGWLLLNDEDPLALLTVAVGCACGGTKTIHLALSEEVAG